MTVPRSEYPRPQFVRSDWLCLNGEWQFEIDAGDSGLERGLVRRELQGRITVPFCPESTLSGVGNTDFLNAVWYRRQVEVPRSWEGKRIMLHFQAVDYDATVWADGIEVGRHRGGFTPFTCDLTGVAKPGQAVALVVRARDPGRTNQPRGKQSREYANHGCLYTRTTGIWQTVWLEPVPQTYLLRPRLTPDLAAGKIRLQQPIAGPRDKALMLRAIVRDRAEVVSAAIGPAAGDFAPMLDLEIPEQRRKLWSPGSPHLYDVELDLFMPDGTIVDKAVTYTGLRSVTIDGPAVKINGKTVFQRLVLDQGYYADGILTAPTDEALRRDIELSLAAGFNGARLHEKVFEERFLYHADRLGYLVWGEFPDWGVERSGPEYVTQWLEALVRDYSHPSIIGWCGLNESAQAITDRITPQDDITWGMFLADKAMDATRPVLDASGYSHRVLFVDVYDCHDYEQDPAKFRNNQAGLAEGRPFMNGPKDRPISTPWRGQPFFVSEFGGIWWNPNVKPGEPSWGYGERPKTIEELHDRFEKLCAILLDDPNMFGYCYTQLTDVFQEQNGIYFFDRSSKFDVDRIRRAQQRPAAIER